MVVKIIAILRVKILLRVPYRRPVDLIALAWLSCEEPGLNLELSEPREPYLTSGESGV